jgi:hypothetical protein
MSPIYLRHGDEFVAMNERPYEAEDLLQALLAEHPEVLAGEDTGTEARGWVLVRREAGVADEEGGAGRWSLDHLFLDSAGVPTLVEVKRSSDTRARREVVAQMLDYAANATAFWKVDLLQAWFETECERRGTDSAAALEEAFGVTDPDGYWSAVQTNLAADRIRLVFVADEVSPELRSIVEFLNRRMTETEVLAIEVKQYVDADGGRQTIVPRVVGSTEQARAAKRTRSLAAGPEFDLSTAPPDVRELIIKMDALAEELGLNVRPAHTGRNYRPPVLESGVKSTTGIGVYTSARGAEFNLTVFRDLGRDDLADDILQRIRDLTGRKVAKLWPAVPCETLLRDWDHARSVLIEPYFEARSRLSGTKGPADSGDAR